MKKAIVFSVLSFCLTCVAGLWASASEITVTTPKPPGAVQFNMGTSVNPQGSTITMDGQAMLIDGQPVIPVMGEIHFSRVPQAEWKTELLKMKAGGINIIANYVFWIHHEEVQGEYDWSGQRDLGKFVETCKEIGLPVILRIGPWCHGEARNGGLPYWLVESGMRLRNNNPDYLAKVRGWYQSIFNQVEGQMWKDGGSVVGIQLDNEYRGPWEHLMTLKTIAQEIGFDVPIYTRTGWPALTTKATFGEIIPLYGDYPDGFWDRSLNEMPGNYSKVYLFKSFRNSTVIATEQLPPQADTDRPEDLVYPYFTCELGGGMMTSYHRRINIAPMDIYAMALVKVGSGSNLPGYYMYHGGTNPEGKLSYLNEAQATPYTNHNDLPVKTYDFQTPLGEFGQVNPHYHLLRRMHIFLADFGPDLSRMDAFFPENAPEDPKKTDELYWSVRSNGHSGYVFVNNYQRLREMPAKTNTQFTVNLPGGQLQFPRQPFTVPSGTAFFMPFNMKVAEAELVYATAQPVAQIEKDGVKTLFFAEIEGIPAEFVWKKEIQVDKSTVSPQTEKGVVRFANVPAGTQTAMELKDRNGKSIRIVLLGDKQSLGLYKGELAGEERVFLTDNLLTYDGNEIILAEADGKEFTVSIFPAPSTLANGKKKIKETPDGIFTAYKINGEPSAAISVSLDKIRDAGPLREIKMGVQKVAEQPSDEEFAAAAVWKVSLDVPKKQRESDLFLEIPYVGDVARVYLDGKLLTDNFYNGKSMLLGLKRYAPAIYEGDLTVEILPFQKDAPIYLQRGNEIDFKGTGSYVQLSKVDGYEKRQVKLTAN